MRSHFTLFSLPDAQKQVPAEKSAGLDKAQDLPLNDTRKSKHQDIARYVYRRVSIDNREGDSSGILRIVCSFFF